ncbi:MAG: hypothetical protein DMG05_17660 [Acidobacteria bacterium]|nr:MAG: hypothetical protein DMG05_17660 [Acidobacteriota bacterium]
MKKFKTGRDREGEAPAEPHGARTSGAMARQEARPPNSFTPSLPRRGIIIHAHWWRQGGMNNSLGIPFKVVGASSKIGNCRCGQRLPRSIFVPGGRPAWP